MLISVRHPIRNFLSFVRMALSADLLTARRETHEDVSCRRLCTSRPERITQKVELLDVVITFSNVTLTVNYLRLLLMGPQSTDFKAVL